MDELTDQLRNLGEAAQADVAAISAASVRDRPSTTAIDVTEAPHTGPATAPTKRSRRPSRRVFIGAAAALLVALGSLSLINRPETEQAVGVTGAQARGGDRAVPTDDNGWAALRWCESETDYTADTGNSFHGVYQLTRPAFRATAERLGMTQYADISPASAPPEVQDAIANALYLERGADAWPICGRFLRGPMVTPVVPQWLAADRSNGSTIVVIDPDLPEEGVAELSREITAAVGDATFVSVLFVTKQESFEEFQAMFDNDDLSASVAVQDMPPRLEFSGYISPEQQQRLREIPGVFEVVDSAAAPGVAAIGPLHLSIPAIDIDEAVYPSSGTANLEAGVVVIGDAAQRTVIGGFGSVENSVFVRLDELRSGDVVILSSLVTTDDASYEISQEFVVDLSDLESTPPLLEVEGIGTLGTRPAPQVILVADVAGDATLRTVVTATAIEADLSRYVTLDHES